MSLFEADLGEGRQWSRVGDGYCVTRKPRGLDRSAFPEIPFAAMEAIPQGGAYAPVFTMKPPEAIASGTYFERGDILVGKITPSFENGKQALVNDLPAPFGYATTEVIPLRPRDDGHDPRLLFFYLLHPDVRHYVAERMEGSTGRKRVPENVLLDLPIPLLDLEVQVAMADALEAIQQASSAESRCELMAQDLKRSAMRVLFTRGVNGEAQKETEIGPVPESWEQMPISALGQIITGNTPPTKDIANYVNGEIPFIAPGDIEHGRAITWTEKFVTKKGLEKSRPIKGGATCFVCIGSTIGKVGFATAQVCVTNQQINSIIPNDRFDPLFVFFLMTYWADQIRKEASPSPVPILSKGVFQQIEIFSSVDKVEQKKTSTVLAAIDRKIDLHRHKRAVLDELFKALLHKLMTGEIHVADLDLSALSPQAFSEVAV
jgi:type I restriction enzyme S subunit